jgi:hypothetical protein
MSQIHNLAKQIAEELKAQHRFTKYKDESAAGTILRRPIIVILATAHRHLVTIMFHSTLASIITIKGRAIGFVEDHQYEFADPAFPDNMYKEIQKLKESDGD